MRTLKRMKYVVTDRREPIMFSMSLEHSTFKDLAPRSAGFVDVCADDRGNIVYKCFGESLSLGGLKSMGDRDERLFNAMGRVF